MRFRIVWIMVGITILSFFLSAIFDEFGHFFAFEV